MDKITTWKDNRKQWHACRFFRDTRILTRYAFNLYGTGKTKKEAIKSLCETILHLDKNITSMIHLKFKSK